MCVNLAVTMLSFSLVTSILSCDGTRAIDVVSVVPPIETPPMLAVSLASLFTIGSPPAAPLLTPDCTCACAITLSTISSTIARISS
uniref:Putative secreted protein n=1 Tax=Anopheles marajoara TaxID=58244 RepID=A0A2M4CAW5_9DIPT